jgi:hypothetical protein
MSVILTIHRILGEMILPLLIIVAAIWLTIAWKPGADVHPVARFFPVLIDIQVTLGLFFFIYGLIIGNPRYFSFPFILHPIIGILAAGVVHMGLRPDGPARSLGRWAPLATLGVLLLLVVGNIMLAMSA